MQSTDQTLRYGVNWLGPKKCVCCMKLLLSTLGLRLLILHFNPRRACAARVTVVVVLSVTHSVINPRRACAGGLR